ncbi:MAG: YraN family protein [Opitutales bacterium]|nr:YraN family protein [Opitutales bacterium]
MDLLRRIFGFFRRKKNIGQIAEDAAAKFLKKEKGLKILARNYRKGRYETDIIAFDKPGRVIVFAEVKCRPVYAKVRGFFAAASKRKKECLKKSAKAFLRESRAFGMGYRFDVIEVEHDGNQKIVEIRHIENAFF